MADNDEYLAQAYNYMGDQVSDSSGNIIHAQPVSEKILGQPLPSEESA